MVLRIPRAMTPVSPPPQAAFTRREWAIVRTHRTPEAAQRFLNRLRYNRERHGETLRSFREVIRRGEAHCLEAALVAAVILEQHGYPPQVLSFESQDGIDHVIFVFQRRGRWGSVARSRDAGLHGRRPVFRSIRDLVWSYFDPYVDLTGRIKGYELVQLADLGTYDWRFARRNMWKVEQYLLGIPHRRLRSSNARYRRLLETYKAFRSQHPRAPAVYYGGRNRWMLLTARALAPYGS